MASRKMSIDTLMDEMQPVVLEKKKHEYQEKWKILTLSGYLGVQKTCFRKSFPKEIKFSMVFYIHKIVDNELDAKNSTGCFEEKSNLISKTYHTILQYLAFPSINFLLWGFKSKNWHTRMFLHVKKRLILCWKECCHWILMKAGLLFRKKYTSSIFRLHRSVRIAILCRCIADKKLLIAAKIVEIDNFVLKSIKSGYQNGWRKKTDYW